MASALDARRGSGTPLPLPPGVLSVLFVTVAPLAGQEAQQARIVIGPESHVASDPEGRPMVEPHLSVRPGDPAHLLLGVIVSSPDLTDTDCSTFVSFNAAESWARHEFGLSSCGDPWGAILEDGTAVMTLLGARPDEAGEDGAVELLVYRSEDGGRSWPEPPMSLGRGHDHQTIAVDATGGERHGTVYVASVQSVRRPEPERSANALFLARSVDGGRSFEEFRSYPLALDFNAMTPAVLPDGRLLLPFSDYGRRAPGGQAPLEVERDWLVFSADGGETMSAPYMITDACARTWSELSVDASDGPNRGRLYYACNDGAYENIRVHRSDDGGLSWSEPMSVNQESARRPYARTPGLEVAGDGTVGVMFYDGRGSGSFMHIFRCQRAGAARLHPYLDGLGLDGGYRSRTSFRPASIRAIGLGEIRPTRSVR